MFSIPTSLHPRKAHSRDFRPPQLWPWSFLPTIEPSSSTHRHTRIIFRLSNGNRGWSWGRKACGQEFTEGSRQRLGGRGGCVLSGWAVFRGAIPYRQRGWETREGEIGDTSLPLKTFSYTCANISSFSAATGNRRRLHSLEREVPRPPALRPAPRLPSCCFSPWRYSSAARPLNFRGGGAAARSALQLRGFVGLLGPAPPRNPACHW